MLRSLGQRPGTIASRSPRQINRAPAWCCVVARGRQGLQRKLRAGPIDGVTVAIASLQLHERGATRLPGCWYGRCRETARYSTHSERVESITHRCGLAGAKPLRLRVPGRQRLASTAA